MLSKSHCRLLLLASLIWMLAGCGYHLTNTSVQRLPAGQALWVPFIGNESISPTAQTVLRRALYDECHALRGLVAAGNEAAADLYLKGKLVSYSSRIISYTAADLVREYRLTLDVELELYRTGVTVPLWKGMLQASSNFPANADLALQRNAEERALDAAARIIAQKFILSTEQSY